MSSFDYTDNFSGFNDLINRAEILEEKNWKQLVKGADLTGKLKTYRTDEGDKIGASSRVKNLITIGALERMNIIDEELAKALRRKATSSTHITDILKGVPKLYDELFEGDNPRSLEVVQYIEDNTKELIPYAVKNFTRSEYGAKTEEELKSIDFIDVADDAKEELSDAVGQLDAAESELADSLQMSKEDPTTFIEIKIRDAERVEDVGNIVSKYANEDGLDISGDTVQFSVDPDTPLANAVTAHGIDKIEAALKRDVDRISDSVVVVMAPDEDYERMDDEEMGYGLDKPGGVPGSYAMGEEGGGITEVEDEESNIKLSLAGKEYFIGVDDPNDDGIITDIEKYQNGYMIYGGVFHDEQDFWDGEEPKEGYMYAIDFNGELMDENDLVEAKAVEDNEDEAAARKKPGGSNVGDYPNVSKDDFCGPAGGAPEGSYPVNSERRARAALAYAHNAPDPEGIKNCVYRKAKKHGWFDKPDEEDNELDHFLTKEQPEDYIPSTDYEDVLDALVNDDKKKHAMKKLGSEDEESILSKIEQDISNGMTVKESMDSLGIHPSHQKDMLHKYLAYTKEYSEGPVETGFENEEEAIKMQPMLESHKTNTSVYLTEQVASDKRNKKTETKNQSFKEKYKPKTSWQLEELRRYGL